jgi:hypothetical protein
LFRTAPALLNFAPRSNESARPGVMFAAQGMSLPARSVAAHLDKYGKICKISIKNI